jgi:peptidyl-prolyl cis-trans isomerase C
MTSKLEDERVADDAEPDEVVADEDGSDEDEGPEAAGDSEPGPKSRKRPLLLVLALVVLLGAGTGGYLWYRAAQLPADAAFRLDDRAVTTDELNRQVDTLGALYGIKPPQDQSELDGFRRDAAKSYAVSMVLDKAARSQNIVIADKVARDTLAKFISQQLGDGPAARDKFIQALGNAGTSEQAVLDEIKRQLAVSQLFNKVTEGAAVTDQEVVDAFGKRKDELGTPERRQLHNIVVRTKEEADQVMAALNAGTPFDTEARQRSLDSATRDSGGDLGQLTAAQLQADYAKVAFSAAAGTTFGPVQNQFGWNIGKVVGVLAPVPAVFEQVKDQFKQKLVLEEAMSSWRGWLGEQIRNAHVEYADGYRPSDPDAAPDTGPGQAPVPGQGQPR